jgi:hypothetical protein
VIKPTEITSTTQFSRASTATYYDADGILQTAAIDELRLNYNPDTLESEGILIEDAATNLLTYSELFSNAVWGASSATKVISEIGPDGLVSGTNFTVTVANASSIAQAVTLPSNQSTLSIFVKAGNTSTLTLRYVSFDTSFICRFDISNGYVEESYGGIEYAGNNWYRCYITVTMVGSDLVGSVFAYLATTPNTAFSSTVGNNMYVFGAQLESGSLSSYIPTVATTVTRAADILGDMVTSSVAEPDLTTTPPEALWVAATNYALDDIVIRTTTHKKYQNIQAGINSTLPEDDAALDTPTRWIEIGSTNRYAMFDTLRNTQTVTTSPLSVILTAGRRIDSIGVLAMEADSITISMVNDGVEVYSFTQNLNTRVTLGWYDYFYGEFSSIPSIVKFDLPPYTDGEIMITLTSATGTVSCGAVIIGNQQYLGQVQYNAVSEEQNFSRIEREFDGTAVLVQRRSIPKINAQLITDKTQTNKIRAARTELNAVPTVWSGLDDLSTDDYFDALLILGIYKRFEIDVAYPEQTIINLELEEI